MARQKGEREWQLDFMFQLYVDGRMYEYVKKKVEDWIRDIRELSEIGWEEPQIALSAYVKGLCHRWKFIQRTSVRSRAPSASAFRVSSTRPPCVRFTRKGRAASSVKAGLAMGITAAL